MSKIFDLPMRDHFMNKNFSRGRSQAIRKIVIHHNAGRGVDPWQTWQTRQASAHCQVWGNGQIDYLVRFEDTAWHAHEANNYSIGIEHENSGGDPNWPIADAGLHASAKLVGYLCAKYKLGAPAFNKNVVSHRSIETDGVGTDTYTACPGPYFLKILGDSKHWYWKEAKQWYAAALGEKPAPTTPTKPSGGGKPIPAKKIHQGAPVPSMIRKGSGNYFGLMTGPSNSLGGFNPNERPYIKMIQQRLIAWGFVPGIKDVNSSWADGKFEQPTREAVIKFQKKYLPKSQFFGQVWYDDWTKLFNL